jgi:hypothetical protein
VLVVWASSCEGLKRSTNAQRLGYMRLFGTLGLFRMALACSRFSIKSGNGLGLRFTALGSMRPGLFPTVS